MGDYLRTDDSFVNSIVGEGTRLKGEFDLDGLVRIDGDFTGSIRTSRKVLIGKNGRAECTIDASVVVIGGLLKGEVRAREKVQILSTGMVIGNIQTPRLIIEEGVYFNGTCTHVAPEAATPKTAPKTERAAGVGQPVPSSVSPNEPAAESPTIESSIESLPAAVVQSAAPTVSGSTASGSFAATGVEQPTPSPAAEPASPSSGTTAVSPSADS